MNQAYNISEDPEKIEDSLDNFPATANFEDGQVPITYYCPEYTIWDFKAEQIIEIYENFIVKSNLISSWIPLLINPKS